jgi:4-amino-4-deoxy-L-arabinose transferase-like glycosyltransferase
MSGASLLSRIYVLRLWNILLASVVIPLVYWIARRALNSRTQALGATAIVVLMPELMINIARVSNEGLALGCYTAMLAAAVAATLKPLSWRPWILIGLALGAGLLSKAYVLSAVPAIIMLAVLVIWMPAETEQPRSSWSSIIPRLASTFVVAVAIAGAWYVRVHRASGTWTGVTDDVAAGHLSLLQKVGQLPHVNWKSGVLSVLISHVWFGAWSFLRVSDVIYVVVFVLIAIAMAGVFVRLARKGMHTSESGTILALAAFYVCFWAGLMYDVLVIYLTKGSSSSAGWYLYAAVAAEIVLLVWGLQAFFAPRVVFLGLATAVAALDLYGTHSLLMPYYTGLTWHVGKSVPPALWATATHISTVFDRLNQLRPPWLSTPMLVAAWIGYCIATIGTVSATYLCFRQQFASE